MNVLAACRGTLRRVFGVGEKEKAVDAIENAVEKIEASIESGEKREWTLNEITRELERTTGDCFVPELLIRTAVESLRQRHRTTELCSYSFKPRNKAVN